MTEQEQQTVDLSVGPLGSFEDAVAFGDALYALEGVTRLALNEFNEGHASFTFTVRSVEAVRDGLLLMPEFSVASVERAGDGSIQVAIGERPYDAYVAEHGAVAEGADEDRREEEEVAAGNSFVTREAEPFPAEMAPQHYEAPQPEMAAPESYTPFSTQHDDADGRQPAIASETTWMPSPADAAPDMVRNADPFRPEPTPASPPSTPFPMDEPTAPSPSFMTEEAPWQHETAPPPSYMTEETPRQYEAPQPPSFMSEEAPRQYEALQPPSFMSEEAPRQYEAPQPPSFAANDLGAFASEPAAPPAGHDGSRSDVSAALIEIARELRDRADALAELAARVADEEQEKTSPAVEAEWQPDPFSTRSWDNEPEVAAPTAPPAMAPAAQSYGGHEDLETDGWTPGTASAWVPVAADPVAVSAEEEPQGWEAPRMPGVGAMAPAHNEQAESGSAGAQAIAMATAMGKKPSQVHLLASGFASFGIANTFIAAVRQIPGVRNVAISELDQGRLRLTLDYFGSDSLEQQLEQLKDFPHQVVRASGKDIEIQLQAA